jgi:AP-3 complex subunit sigma
MIKGVIIVNNLGVVRLAKFYEQVHVTGESAEQAQQSVIKKIYRAVSKRQDNQCNYLEGSIPEWGGDTKLIYRHYATLYFVFACTNRESDLGILDLIQVFVEALDRSFENVCELDLIFHSDKCHYVLDEIIIGGLVLDTSITNIMGGADDQNKLHKSSLSLLTSGPKKTQIGARPGSLSSGYQ